MADHDFKGLGGGFVKEFSLTEGNLVLKQRWLSLFQANAQARNLSQASILVQPEWVLVTTQPQLCGQLAGIAELQFRQDELKQDFSHAIQRLIPQITNPSNSSK